MRNLFLRAAGLIAIFFIPFSSLAQSKGFQRFQLGYSFPMTKAKYSERYLIYQDLSDDNIDTTMSKDVRTKGGFGITLGHFFPVAKMGEKSSPSTTTATGTIKLPSGLMQHRLQHREH